MTAQQREDRLLGWLGGVLGRGVGALTPASADASFRRYWRLRDGERSLIAVDAPPEREDTRRFVALAAALAEAGLNPPQVLAADASQGFLLLSDLGAETYLERLDADSAETLYADAIDALVRLQRHLPSGGLPPYDAALLRRELALFGDWLLDGLLGLRASAADRAVLAAAAERLVANALAQPQVAVHRDFHSRNLMVTARANPGVLDFQDAVRGPLTYDLVSLLRDCYIAWPQERVDGWTARYLERARQHGLLAGVEQARFREWFDLMGLQRHLKAAGIFARLAVRDGRRGYLGDLPRTLGYVVAVAPSYPELGGLAELVEARVLPAVQRLLAAPAR